MLSTPEKTGLTRGHALTEIALTAVAVAFTAAALQVLWQLGWTTFANRIIFASRDLPWMAPASWLVFMAGCSLPFLALGALVPKRWVVMAASGFLGGVAAFVFMLRYDAIATWAGVAVGAGIGVRFGGLAAGAGFAKWRMRIAGFSLAALAILTVAVRMAFPEHGKRATLADTNQPNVLLVVLDVTRAASVSGYGYPKPTAPAIERLAAEGLLAEKAYATAPWTLPSHATMFTGVYSPEIGVDFFRGLSRERPTLAEVLAERGYATGGFTANEVYTGWDSRVMRGFDTTMDYMRTPFQVLLSGWPWQVDKMYAAITAQGGLRKRLGGFRYASWRMPVSLYFDHKIAEVTADQFLGWHKTLESDRPFFAFLNMFDAHTPRWAPPEFMKRFSDNPSGQDKYDAGIAYMDFQLGRIVDSLRVRGDLDNTILAVVGDHGELFGEHEVWGHATAAYRELLWVPLVMRYPSRITAGTRLAGTLSLRDLPATLLDLTGRPGPLPGNSLLGSGPRSPAFSYANKGINVETGLPNAKGPVVSVALDSVQYIRHPDGKEMLFHFADKKEATNLVSDAAYATDLSRARHLTDSLGTTGKR